MRHEQRRNDESLRRVIVHAAFLTGLLAATLPAASALADRVVLENGRDKGEDVRVLAATWEEVELRAGRSRKETVPAAQIATLERDSEALAPTRRRFALASYKEVLVDVRDFDADFKEAAPWEKAEAAYLLAEATLKLGKRDEAKAAYEAYLETYGEAKDWWVPFAAHRLVEIAESEEKYGTAATLGEKLARYGGRWQVIGRLAQGRNLLRTNNASAAETVLNEVVRLATDPELKQEARVLRIEATFVAGNPGQAIQDLDTNFFAAIGGELLYGYARGRATLLMGQSYVALGGDENEQQGEVWLQQTVALYGQHEELLAAASDELANLYKKQGKTERAAFWEKRKPTKD